MPDRRAVILTLGKGSSGPVVCCRSSLGHAFSRAYSIFNNSRRSTLLGDRWRR